MRLAVFVLAAIQIGLLIAMAASIGSSDPAGAAMSTGIVTLAGILMAVFLAPALILALNRKALKLSVLLSTLSLALVMGVLNVI